MIIYMFRFLICVYIYRDLVLRCPSRSGVKAASGQANNEKTF